LLAVPLAVLSSSPDLGVWFARWGLCAMPEQFDTPEELRHDAASAPIEPAPQTAAVPAEELSAASAG